MKVRFYCNKRSREKKCSKHKLTPSIDMWWKQEICSKLIWECCVSYQLAHNKNALLSGNCLLDRESSLRFWRMIKACQKLRSRPLPSSWWVFLHLVYLQWDRTAICHLGLWGFFSLCIFDFCKDFYGALFLLALLFVSTAIICLSFFCGCIVGQGIALSPFPPDHPQGHEATKYSHWCWWHCQGKKCSA